MVPLQEAEVVKCIEHLDAVVILVNDGSTDGTLALLQQISSVRPESVKVLDLRKNVGKVKRCEQVSTMQFHLRQLRLDSVMPILQSTITIYHVSS